MFFFSQDTTVTLHISFLLQKPNHVSYSKTFFFATSLLINRQMTLNEQCLQQSCPLPLSLSIGKLSSEQYKNRLSPVETWVASLEDIWEQSLLAPPASRYTNEVDYRLFVNFPGEENHVWTEKNSLVENASLQTFQLQCALKKNTNVYMDFDLLLFLEMDGY